MSRYKLILRCNNFKHGPHKYTKTVDVNEEAGETLDDVPNPPCPLCKKLVRKRDEEPMATAPLAITPLEEWVQDGKAPAQIGKNNTVKAIDLAAQIAMEDYKLTDLKDNVRHGEVMAPRLPPVQQAMADNFFNPGSNPAMNKRRQAQMKMLGQRAIKGAFRAQALDVKAVLPDSRVALHKVREEPLNSRR